jgi:hypothetical protein
MGGSSSSHQNDGSISDDRSFVQRSIDTANDILAESIPGGECIETPGGFVYIENTPEQNNAQWEELQSDPKYN